MLRPIAPFVEYAIDYDYISKVLCINKDEPELQCNGKCQLMIKLKEQQENDYNSLSISLKDYPIGFVKITSIKKRNIFSNTKINNYLHQQNYTFLYIGSVFHPPTI